MEEGDKRKHAEASGHHPDVTDKPDLANLLQNRIEAFDIGDSGFIAKDDTSVQGVTSADRVFKDDDFEQVSLGDQEKAANESQGHLKEPGSTPNSDHGRSSYGGTEGVTYHLSGTQEMYDLMPMDDVQSDRLKATVQNVAHHGIGKWRTIMTNHQSQIYTRTGNWKCIGIHALL